MNEDRIEDWLYIIYAIASCLSSYLNLLCVFFCALYYAILTSIIDDCEGIEDFLKYFPTWVPLFLISGGLFFFVISVGFTWLLIHPFRIIIIVSGLVWISFLIVLWLMVFWARISREINMRSKTTPEKAANLLICCPCRGTVKYVS